MTFTKSRDHDFALQSFGVGVCVNSKCWPRLFSEKLLVILHCKITISRFHSFMKSKNHDFASAKSMFCTAKFMKIHEI